ncbi:MAG: lipase [Oscillospiraceae bacterium]|nr:lipase [Oscillospiraceae bacterium]
MKNVLFYGDSNTWGYMPVTGLRYPYEQRWTSIAAKLLGEDYHCVASGLSGRTTVFDDMWKDGRNGRDGLDQELQTHKPLDLAVIMLGTNDLKFADACRSARGIETLLMMTKNANARFSMVSPVFPGKAEILLISPILVGDNYENYEEREVSPNGREESKRFASLYRAAAERCGAHFLDAAELAEPSPEDCEHLTVEGHRVLGEAVAAKIKEILG